MGLFIASYPNFSDVGHFDRFLTDAFFGYVFEFYDSWNSFSLVQVKVDCGYIPIIRFECVDSPITRLMVKLD